MIRLLLIAAALPFLSGCVSNPGHYYSYGDGGGDYYYEDAGADVILDGYGPGYGPGYGWGYGGYGYGYSGYYGGYGYSPIWWTPPPVIVIDSPVWRSDVENERARRVALSHRHGAPYAGSAAWARREHLGPNGGHAGLASWGARQPMGRVPAGAVTRPTTTVTQTPVVQSSRARSTISSSYSPQPSGSRTMRSAPAPRMSSRKQ